MDDAWNTAKETKHHVDYSRFCVLRLEIHRQRRNEDRQNHHYRFVVADVVAHGLLDVLSELEGRHIRPRVKSSMRNLGGPLGCNE